MAKRSSIILYKLNLSNYTDYNFIRQHVCNVYNFKFFDLNKKLLHQINQLYICADKYNCNKKMLQVIQEDDYIKFNYYIYILPIKYHNRQLCIIYYEYNNYIVDKTCIGLLSKNYLLIFNESFHNKLINNISYNNCINFINTCKQYHSINNFIKSKIVLQNL